MHKKVIEIRVKNHAGVMSHVTGLFARRAFNIEGILCGPIGDGEESRIFLLVNEDQRLPQLIKQTQKLQDVITVQQSHNYDQTLFYRLHEFVNAPTETSKP